MKEYEEAFERIREYLNRPDMHIDRDVLDMLVYDEFSKPSPERDLHLAELALNAVVALRDYRLKLKNQPDVKHKD